MGLWARTGRTPHTITVANSDERLSRITLDDAIGVTSAATAYSYQHPDVVYLAHENSP